MFFYRVKSFSFNAGQVSVDLPKPLILADVAVRLQLTDIDIFTRQCRTHRCKTRPPSEVDPVINIAGEEEEPDKVAGEQQNEDSGSANGHNEVCTYVCIYWVYRVCELIMSS